MKKVILLVLMAVSGLVFVSCKKEGIYSPKNKIDKIYYSANTTNEIYENGRWIVEANAETPKHLSEVWNWDGKLLKSIAYYSSTGALNYTERYEYDGKRLVSITLEDGDRYVINYEKDKISSIILFANSQKAASFVFTHDKEKVSKITFTDHGVWLKGKNKCLPISTFRFFIPSADMQSFDKMIKNVYDKMGTRDIIDTYDMLFEWDGNNVSKMTYVAGADTYKTEYTYDNKLNPYYGLFNFNELAYDQVLSKNNVVRSIGSDPDNNYDERNYIYTYDGKRPTMEASSSVDVYDNGHRRNTYSYVYYYEYK